MGGAASVAADKVVATVGSVKALPPYLESEVKALMLKVCHLHFCTYPFSLSLPIPGMHFTHCCPFVPAPASSSTGLFCNSYVPTNAYWAVHHHIGGRCVGGVGGDAGGGARTADGAAVHRLCLEQVPGGARRPRLRPLLQQVRRRCAATVDARCCHAVCSAAQWCTAAHCPRVR